METGGSDLASLNQWFVKCGPELAASSSPGNLEMRIPRLTPELSTPEPRGGAQQPVF